MRGISARTGESMARVQRFLRLVAREALTDFFDNYVVTEQDRSSAGWRRALDLAVAKAALDAGYLEAERSCGFRELGRIHGMSHSTLGTRFRRVIREAVQLYLEKHGMLGRGSALTVGMNEGVGAGA
jgi:hypothetical protein